MARDLLTFEKLIPQHNLISDESGDLAKFLSIFQTALDETTAEVDRFVQTFDPDIAPEEFVDAMLLDLGNPFEVELSLNDKRKLIRALIDIYREKGTAAGIENAIRFLTGVDARVVAPSISDSWVLNVDILDPDGGADAAVLGPSLSFTRFSFDVETNAVIPTALQETIRQIVDFMKPAHTHFVSFIVVTTPSLTAEWELDVSELDDTTVLGPGDQSI